MDLTPRVSLVAAQAADPAGNLYTGPNTEDTPAIVEATAFKSGIVIAQVNEVRERLPRVDVPADWVDFVVESPTPHFIEPLFTRDPAKISEVQVLMAMMAIKGIYAEYGINRLNHGIGFDTDDAITKGRTFQLFGSQKWGLQNFRTYVSPDVVHYAIPVGQFYTGSVVNLFFANDHDVSNPTGESTFSNVTIYESG